MRGVEAGGQHRDVHQIAIRLRFKGLDDAIPLRPRRFAGDQRRVMTPLAAVEVGADYLVIGRPITQSSDPAAVLGAINAELCR